MKNAFSFWYLKTSLFHLYFWKIVQLGIESYVDTFFSFSKLKDVVSLFFPLCNVWEAIFIILILVTLYLTSLFSVTVLTIFSSLSPVLITMSNFLLVSYTWGLLGFLDLWIYSLHQIWKIFSFFPPNASFPLRTSIIHILGCLKLFQSSWYSS